MALRAPLRPKNEERFMPTAEKQASVLPSLAKNVTAIPSMDKKHTTIPSNGFSVQYEEIWHDGQKLRPGVWLHSTWDSKLGEQSTHEWICGPLEVEAITRSLQSTDYGRLISFINLDGQERKWAMPNLLLAGKSDSILGTLLTMGLDVSYEHRTKVTAFIAGQRPSARVIAATETGWHGDKLFIMPHQNIGEGQAVYQSEDATQDDYRVGGTLHGWQSSIGSMCAGNPLLLLSICTSLAGPILFHVQMKGGGFHLVGDSSTGKTIATIAGASVWGHGEKFLRTWLATGNGLEGIANERNDTILALDELGEADAREVGAVVYALANGTGKTRATRSGSAKKTKRWRIMLFSTGELGLGAFMAEGGQRIRAGQEIRLLDISAYPPFHAVHAGGRADHQDGLPLPAVPRGEPCHQSPEARTNPRAAWRKRPARRHRLAHPGFGQEPDHGVSGAAPPPSATHPPPPLPSLVRKMRTDEQLRRFKVIVVTDRKDLQSQLAATATLSGEPPEVAANIAGVKALARRKGPGLVFATIQKYRNPELEEEASGAVEIGEINPAAKAAEQRSCRGTESLLTTTTSAR